MSPKQRKVLMFFTVNGFILTVLGIVFGLLSAFGQDIEPYVAGYVIKIPVPDRIWRGYVTKRESGREVEIGCLRFHGLRKLANARPYREAFEVETLGDKPWLPNGKRDGDRTRFSEWIPVSAVPSDDHHQRVDNFTSHAAGAPPWDRSYCFEMPGTIADSQTILVRGHTEHVRLIFGRQFPFWRSVTPVPEFTILPTRCYRPDGSVDPELAECRAGMG